MGNQKPLTNTQIELIRLVMKQVPEAEVIREMQGIIQRFETNNSTFQSGDKTVSTKQIRR